MPGVFVTVPHGLDHFRLLRREQPLATTHSASRPRRRQPGHRALPDQFLFKLRQGRKEMEDESASGGTRIELLLEGDEVDAALI